MNARQKVLMLWGGGEKTRKMAIKKKQNKKKLSAWETYGSREYNHRLQPLKYEEKYENNVQTSETMSKESWNDFVFVLIFDTFVICVYSSE